MRALITRNDITVTDTMGYSLGATHVLLSQYSKTVGDIK